MRRRTLVLIAVASLAVLAGGGLLARFLTLESRERDAIAEVLRAEARGDAADVRRRVGACDRACSFVARLRGPGDVKIARLDSETAYSLRTSEGWSRVVWVQGPGGEPLVQCVRVRREGSVLAGRTITLERLTAPLTDNEGSC